MPKQPTLTKMHFKAIAEILRDSYEIATPDEALGVTIVRQKLVVLFHASNPRFDEARFYKAVEGD